MHLPSLDELDAELTRRSLRAFVRESWPIVEPGVPFKSNWHIDAICDHLEAVTAGEITRLIINIPPRFMKSLTVGVFWPAWSWLDDAKRRWLFASYAEQLSTRDSVKTRRVIQSEGVRDASGDRTQLERIGYQGLLEVLGKDWTLTGDQNVKTKFENTETGYRIATGVEGVGTGEGGDVVVADDPHKVKEAESDTVRTGVCDWWDQTMTNRLNDPKTGALVVVMQRVHQSDLTGHLLEKGDYEHLCLPNEYEPKRQCVIDSTGFEDPRTDPGELLWPERVDDGVTAGYKRALGSMAYAGQYQQRPSPEEGGIIKRAWWRYFNDWESLPAFDDVIQSWDMAFKDLKTSDYVVGQVWGRKGADAYLLHQVRDRLSFTETCKRVALVTNAYPNAHAKLVEDKANGTAVIDALRRKIPGLIAIEPEGGKEARVAATSPMIEAGNVYLPHDSICGFTESFIEECAVFPNGSNDDQVDAMTQALRRFQRTGGKVETGEGIWD